jgi:molybdate transport system substrate-binding protein
LQRQIEQGAPSDVFVSASLAKMKALEEGELLDDSYKNLLKNEIVLVVPNEEAIIKSFDDLKSQEDFIFAMGEPDSVPAGKYASEVLDYLELSEVLSEKTVLAKDVKEVLTWVELGEADAGMVYATDAYVSDKVTIAEEAPAGSHKDIIYPCAVIKSSENKEAAEGFIEFLYSEEALSIFEKYGFKKAE